MLSFLWPLRGYAQLALGQYEEEAPLQTWNILGRTSTASLSRGNTQFALASDSSSGQSNPALLADLPEFTLSLGAGYASASLAKFGPVNTGVLESSENLTVGLYALDYLGVSFRIRGWTVAASAGLTELYDRPGVSSEYSLQSRVLYSLEYIQDGQLRSFNLALARNLGEHGAIGLAVNVYSGSLKRSLVERFTSSSIRISDEKSQNLRGFSFSLGLTYRFSEKIKVGLMVRTPHSRKAEGRSLLEYDSPAGQTNIRLPAEAGNTYRIPLAAGAGLALYPATDFTLTADVTFFNWSGYSLTYFDEDIDRAFRDILRVSLGGEFIRPFALGTQRLKIPLRFGFIYDPQPVTDPGSSYFNLTYGTGLAWGRFYGDIGVLLGWERGSRENLRVRSVSLTLGMRLGKER